MGKQWLTLSKVNKKALEGIKEEWSRLNLNYLLVFNKLTCIQIPLTYLYGGGGGGGRSGGGSGGTRVVCLCVCVFAYIHGSIHDTEVNVKCSPMLLFPLSFEIRTLDEVRVH